MTKYLTIIEMSNSQQNLTGNFYFVFLAIFGDNETANLRILYLLYFVAYTLAKYGMSVCALGMAEEFKKDGIAVNALWPQTSKLNVITWAIDE